MMKLTIKKIAEIVKSKNIPAADAEITSVTIDSRKAVQGGVFFAIKGENHDGHDYISQALASGAACAVAERKISVPEVGKILFVDDTIAAMELLAKFVRDNSGFKVISITGSAGKTTTKNMLSAVLGSKLKCFASPKSYNNNIGVPLTIFEAPDDCEIIISELGSNHPGEIENLTRIISPDIAIITTVCPAHLEGFGSIDTIIKEKTSIAIGLRQGGEFFINGDRPRLVEYCKKNNLKFMAFGTTENCDVSLGNIKLFGDGSKFTVEGLDVNLPLIGRANVENAAAVWAVAKYLGFSSAEFAGAVSKIKPVAMRMETLDFGSVTVISDCYNANPGSMENALQTLSLMAEQKGRRPVFIFGKMGELGAESSNLHSALGRQIAENGIAVVLTIKGEAAIAAKIAKKHASSHNYITVFENLEQLTDNLHKFIKPDDIILVKASRSERFEAVVDKLRLLFS
ncbi:MAG: UDP-N-acetylmuramoyl-tripeptide--D-alanyl-D-alanine ligase [Phycisphaerae bacterium]|nr:UDP-N-acetylmuramoyl-tripeptide--D-alanyl-D-alanine ligase [Phycisphaerae bacterium]